MVLNTFTVGASVTPTVIETYFSHYINRKPLRQKPTAHISYHEGLHLIRRFLQHASNHTVEEIQAFTSQWVPAPQWVKIDTVDIGKAKLDKAADLICAQLGPEGVESVGGKAWWQWRRDNNSLKAEWIEMKKDASERKKSTDPKGTRIILYVHGGAYFFGSVDEHRYQMQRHARKLKARVLAPRYRLAPQFPFPCGLHDSLATYLHLLEEHDPTTIILAGDSAGGGMVLSMLVTLRDQGLPLPAGAILISPWVDLTHSFPSLAGDGKLDYIPSHGFMHRPSMAWPPPNLDDLKALEAGQLNASKDAPKTGIDKREARDAEKQDKKERARGYSSSRALDASDGPKPDTENVTAAGSEAVADPGRPHPDRPLSIMIDGKVIEIKDQIQMYAPNHLIDHPLVSPVLQPSLGGLPPLLIQTGGGELLRDEQIYLAHKAAAPLKYVPAPNFHLSEEFIQTQSARHKPTYVQLQVWDDLCHVAPTLSFTRPAKYMYRSIAQFGAWALARAQKRSIDIMDDDSISVISSSTDTDDDEDVKEKGKPDSSLTADSAAAPNAGELKDAVGRAGDPLPAFEKHMIRQRIDRNGNIYDLSAVVDIPALQLEPSSIGVIKEEVVRKWMDAQQKWSKKFARQKLTVQRKRVRDMAKGYEGFEGERPPPTALAGRRIKGLSKPAEKRKKSMGLMMWSMFASKHDEVTIEQEQKADADGLATINEENADGTKSLDAAKPNRKARTQSRSKSRHRPRFARVGSHRSAVSDQGQTTADEVQTVQHGAVASETSSPISPTSPTTPSFVVIPPANSSGPVVPGTDTVVPVSDTLSTRPTRDGIAYPFKLRLQKDGLGVNASTLTLNSVAPGTPKIEEEKKLETPVSTATAEKQENGTVEKSEGTGILGLNGTSTSDEKKIVPNVEGSTQFDEPGKPERPQPERFVTAPEL